MIISKSRLMASLLLIPAIVIFSGRALHKEASRTHIVTITPSAFEPQSLEIDFRDTVLWINKSNRTHQIADEQGRFKSFLLIREDSFYHVFSKSGVFRYHCRRHRTSGMTGTVKVFIH